MKLVLCSALTCLALLLRVGSSSAASSETDFSGRWEVTTTFPGNAYVAGLNLINTDSKYTGRSGFLVPEAVFPYLYSGAVDNNSLNLQILAPDAKTVMGTLTLHLKGGLLSGSGTLHNVPITVVGHRPLSRPPDAPTLHVFEPKLYYGTFSGSNPPALHIFPGDTVRTKTVDAYGNDEKGVHRTIAGNAQTGPFYVEGAMVGDTLVVHFNRIRPNRDTAMQFRSRLTPGALPPGYPQESDAPQSSIWKLDLEHGTATPDQPTDKLRSLTVALIPMLGCVSVAPYLFESYNTSHLGPFGGNLDYNQIREGTTLHMPVFQAGALLTIGDGHALQADGELTGQGLETSMDVEFTVSLIRDELLDQPWAENEDNIMVSGVGGSLNDALQKATAGLSNWLKAYYGLDSAEIATLLGTSVHYDIAEIVDPEFHVVARIDKLTLRQIPKPQAPSSLFCQTAWGCMRK